MLLQAPAVGPARRALVAARLCGRTMLHGAHPPLNMTGHSPASESPAAAELSEHAGSHVM